MPRKDFTDTEINNISDKGMNCTNFVAKVDEKTEIDRVVLSDFQKSALESLIRASKTSQSLSTRAQIILSLSNGTSKYQIKKETGCAYTTINRWEKRWIAAYPDLMRIEQNVVKSALSNTIVAVLGDNEKSGAPPTFTSEQVVQIITLACTPPADLGIPVSQWSTRLLAKIAVELEIVKSISHKQVANFFCVQTLNRIAPSIG